MLDGEAVGYCALGLSPQWPNLLRGAHLWAGGTRIAFRGRGVQRAMLAGRMRIARELGHNVAFTDSAPGIVTARNVRRLGFQQIATTCTLVRPGEGLVPSP